MKHSGYNPVRRNRNIGTKKSGLGQDNRLKVSWAWADDRIFYERLVNPIEIEIEVNGVNTHVIVEPTLKGFSHSCTIDDICRVLELIPTAHIEDISAFVLRQPKRKEQILKPVWGRLVYWSNVCGHSGPMIYLEAQNENKPLKWTKSLTPDMASELNRLRKDGYSINADKRSHIIKGTLKTIRNTQLYRTLPHEIGHYVDYLTKVEHPSLEDPDSWSMLDDKYHSRPHKERESFAHRYADEFLLQRLDDRQLPFDRIIDHSKMESLNLDPEWFGVSTS